MAYKYLAEAKKMIGITGTYQDEALNGYAEEAIEFLVSAGIKREVAEGKRAKGVVTRGISDLWNLGSGNAALSPYFKERAIQLAYKGNEDEF